MKIADIEEILRFQAREGNVFDYSNDTVVVTRALLTHAADQIAKMKAERLMLDKRIHNQRKACRDTWEIVEKRAQYSRAWYPSELLNSILRRGR